MSVTWTSCVLAFVTHKVAGLNLRSSSADGNLVPDGDKLNAGSSPLIADAGSILEDGQEQGCSFELYDPQADMLGMVDPGPEGVVFHQGSVFVVDGALKNDGSYQRYLTFKQDNGPGDAAAFSNFFGGTSVQQMVRPRCREQVQVTCLAHTGSRSNDALIAGVQTCDSKLCRPDARENMVPEYRVLLGSALSGQGHLGRVAVLGFGAGIIPAALAESHPEAVVEAVDISVDVLAAAGCFGVEANDKMKLVESDARAYMENLDDGVLDMLFVDIYDDKANIPPCFTTSEFFRLAKRKLTKDGTLAMNLVTKQLQDVVPSVVSAFASVKVGSLSGNRGNNVLLAFPSNGTSAGDESMGTRGDTSSGMQDSENGFASVFSAWERDGTFAPASQANIGAARTDATWCK